jgi:hypothetical protein
LEAPVFDVDATGKNAAAGSSEPATDEAPVVRDNLDDLYPDVDLPEEVARTVASP